MPIGPCPVDRRTPLRIPYGGVGAQLEQRAHRIDVTAHGGPDQCRPATRDLDLVHPGAGIRQQPDDLGMAIAGGEHQRRVIALLVQVHLSAGGQQFANRVQPAELRGKHQRCPVTGIALIQPTVLRERREQRESDVNARRLKSSRMATGSQDRISACPKGVV